MPATPRSTRKPCFSAWSASRAAERVSRSAVSANSHTRSARDWSCGRCASIERAAACFLRTSAFETAGGGAGAAARTSAASRLMGFGSSGGSAFYAAAAPARPDRIAAGA